MKYKKIILIYNLIMKYFIKCVAINLSQQTNIFLIINICNK